MDAARNDLKAIYMSAIESVNPLNAVKSHLQHENGELIVKMKKQETARFTLNQFENIFVVGSGKATASMAGAVEDILGDLITEGCICVKYGYTEKLNTIETVEASHPIPDGNGILGSKKILDILERATEKDLVISLISGGGSALLPLPPEPVTLEEKRAVTDLLLKSGASIHEINCVRKHLSRIKGGNLARAAYPATVINLMISDVVGDNMDVIASGPFVPDNSTFSDAFAILQKFGLINTVPGAVLDRIQLGKDGKIGENPGPDSEVFKKVTNLITASNIQSLETAKKTARELGYNAIILSSLIEGDTASTAVWHSRIAREVLQSSNPVPPPACIISGGETTVEVRGSGLGGRNMEVASQAARWSDGIEGLTMASIGTDGSDGPTDAAGAVADWTTVKRGRSKNLPIEKFIENNDSYNYFKQTRDLIITGPTNTNVMDIRIMLVKG